MSEQMFAALGDLLEPDIPSGAELLELAELIERAEAAMSGRDREIPGATWIGDRFIDLLRRRMGGKPITATETSELINQLHDHATWVEATHGMDVHTDGWERTMLALAHIAETCETPARYDPERQCRQWAAYGLLTTAVCSPATWRGVRGDLPF